MIPALGRGVETEGALGVLDNQSSLAGKPQVLEREPTSKGGS